MKPFLTKEQADNIVEGFHKELRSSGRPSARDDLRAALEPLTIAPPKAKLRAGQYVILPYLGAAYPVLAVDPFTCRYEVHSHWWDESELRPLAAAEIAGPEEEA